MSSHTAAGVDTPPAAPKLTDRLTWDQIANLNRDDAIAHTVSEFRRHRFSPRTCWTLLLGVLAAAVLAAPVIDVIFGPLTVVAVAWVTFAHRDQVNHDWALDQIELADPPTGRLHVLVLLLSYTRAGGCDRDAFTRLLAQAPDELSCAALGRHMHRVCPHANVTW